MNVKRPECHYVIGRWEQKLELYLVLTLNSPWSHVVNSMVQTYFGSHVVISLARSYPSTHVVNLMVKTYLRTQVAYLKISCREFYGQNSEL